MSVAHTKSVICIQTKQRLRICKESLFCHRFFNFSLRNLWNMRICAGRVGDAFVSPPPPPARAPGGLSACPSFSGAHQQPHEAEMDPAPHSTAVSPLQAQCDSVCPLSVWICLWGHALPETDKAKQYRMLRYSRSKRK